MNNLKSYNILSVEVGKTNDSYKISIDPNTTNYKDNQSITTPIRESIIRSYLVS